MTFASPRTGPEMKIFFIKNTMRLSSYEFTT